MENKLSFVLRLVALGARDLDNDDGKYVVTVSEQSSDGRYIQMIETDKIGTKWVYYDFFSIQISFSFSILFDCSDYEVFPAPSHSFHFG